MTAYMNQNLWASLAQAQQDAGLGISMSGLDRMTMTSGTTTFSPGSSLYVSDCSMEEKPKPSKFKKLTNHRFHELLDKYKNLID